MLQAKLEQVRSQLRSWPSAVVAYSGGIDSSLVAYLAFQELGDRALAVTAVSASLLPEDLAAARSQADWIGIAHEQIHTDELANPNYASNPSNRCYFCKSELHDRLQPLAQARGFAVVLDGVNADDLGDHRPGLQAARERGVRSPLAEAGIGKLEVRQLAQELGIPWWNKPAMPCLSSRFPYGEAISAEKLARVGAAERYLRQLGWQSLRVRSQQDTARIELPHEDLQRFVVETDLPALVSHFQSLGFRYVSLDLEGLVSGKLNRVLATPCAGDRS